MKKDELEDLFKDSFENFEADVNPGVWKNIQTGLKGAGLGILGKMLINKIGSNAIVAIVSSAAAIVGTVLVMNIADDKKATTPKTNVEPKVIADTQKPSVDEIKNFLATENNAAKKETLTPKNEAAANGNEEISNTNETANKKDKKQIQSLLAGDRIASISSSIVSGTVPMIINLSNIGSGKINKWTFNDGSKPIVENNPVKYFAEPGIYTITLISIDANGKTAIDSIKVEALANSSIEAIPAEFSPNGDNQNDVFIFKSENILKMQVVIFDKEAKKVYEYKGTGFNWDGKTQKGEKAKEGIYLYKILAEGGDGKKYERTGKIKLTR